MTNKEYLKDLQKGDLIATAYDNCFRLGFFCKFGLKKALYYYDVIHFTYRGGIRTFKAKPWRVTTSFVGRVLKVDRQQLTDKQIELVDKAEYYLKTNGLL